MENEQTPVQGNQQDNEANQDLAQNSTGPSNHQPQPVDGGTPKKSNKRKVLLLFIILFTILGAAAAAYLLTRSSGDNENLGDTSNSNQPEAQVAFVPTLYVQTGPLTEFINVDGGLSTYANLEANDVVTDVRKVGDTTRTYYYTTSPDDFWSEVISSYSYVEGGEKTEVAIISDGNATYASPVLSPDGSKFVLEAGYAGSGLMGDVYIYDTVTGNKELLYAPAKTLDENRELFTIVGWLDNNTVLVQEQSCRECDGPRKAVLHTINTSLGKISPLFNQDNSIATLSWAQTIISDGKIYLYGGDFGKVFGEDFDTDFAPDELYEINAKSGESRLIATFDNDTVQIANIDKGNMYLTVKDWVATDDVNAPTQTIDGNFELTPPQLLKVDLASGDSKQVQLETKFFTKDSYVQAIFASDNGYTIQTSTSFQEEVDNKLDSGVQYALFNLPTSGDNNEITIIKEYKSSHGDSFVGQQLLKVVN